MVIHKIRITAFSFWDVNLNVILWITWHLTKALSRVWKNLRIRRKSDELLSCRSKKKTYNFSLSFTIMWVLFGRNGKSANLRMETIEPKLSQQKGNGQRTVTQLVNYAWQDTITILEIQSFSRHPLVIYQTVSIKIDWTFTCFELNTFEILFI